MDLEPSKIVDFHYEYRNFDEKPAKLVFAVEIPYRGSVNELCHQIIASRMDPIMKFLKADAGLRQALHAFIERENQLFCDSRDEMLLDKLRDRQLDVDALALDTEKLYRDELLEYADRVGPSDAEIFAQSYHQLVHSSLLLEILSQEQEYAKIVMNLHGGDSELHSTRGHQRHEYRNWITTHIDENFLAKSGSPTQAGNRWSMISTQAPSMEESFTIHLGSQLKHMHNIRILSTKISELCSPLYGENVLGGPNVALELYSSSLRGIVVLTPSGTIASDPEIRRNANMSTEFHFDQIDSQVKKIRDDLRNLVSQEDHGPVATERKERDTVTLKPGDTFITRHSNLSHTHVVFHLVSDEVFQSPSEINSRHPVILGLRNILKISSRHDITTLTIPALLRHEMSEDMTVSWCVRRAELVFKCAKGFMIESASWGGAELNTLQLLLPHDISEELFRTLADMVPHVFRVANPKILQ